MLKFIRAVALLLLLSISFIGCDSSSSSHANATPTAIPKPTSTPTPTPIVYDPPSISTPTPTPQATPSCFLWVFSCTTSTPVPCQSHYVYDDLINMGESWIVVNQQQDQNEFTYSIQATLTSTTAKTVMVTDKLAFTTSYSESVGVSEDGIESTITESVKTEINHSVSRSVTVTIGNDTTVTIPVGKTVYGNYGVRVQVTDGRLYDQAGCEGTQSYFGPDITYVPIATGWCIWISGQPPCPSVQS